MKTKKTKLFVFLTVLLFLVAPVFSGCDVSIKLNKPTFVNYQVNSKTGEQMLITDNNIYAKDSGGWIFGISTVYDGQDTSNFFTYRSTEPYFYVTDIFVNAQTYYFYSQAIGSGEYVSSDISDVGSVTITYKLDTPVLDLTGTMLSWTAVKNATTYIIYANDVVVTEVNTNSYDISNYIASQSSSQPYTFTVACKQNNNYLKSASSNGKMYTDHLVLSAPTSLRVNSGVNKTLTWNSVANCNKYKVLINGSIEQVVYTNSLNITDLYNQNGVGTYTFKVMAVGEGYFSDSEYSQTYTDTYTKQLATPTSLNSAVGIDYIKLSWSQVENASEYAVFINGVRFYINESTGVNSPVVNNSVIIKNEDLLSYNLTYLTYQVQAIASDGSFYTNSGLSNTEFIDTTLTVLPAPIISVDSVNENILINNVKGAQVYKIDYTYNGITQPSVYINAGIADVIYFDYKAQFVQIGEYTLKVMAIAEHELLNSTYSNEVSFEIFPPIVKLQVPTINDVYVYEDYLYIDFDKNDEKSYYFSLYANNILIDTSLTHNFNFIRLDDLFGIVGSSKTINFCLSANSTDEWHLASSKSNTVEMSTVLTEPTNVKLNGSTLSWEAVENAQTYCLVLDNNIISLNSSTTSINVTKYIAKNKTRQIKLFAHTKYFTDSDCVGGYIYNNVSTQHTGYTDKYFFYGETYDYYITSQEELNDLFKYAVDNFIEVNKFYIDYNTNVTNSEKMNEAIDNLTGSYGFYYTRSGGSSTSGEASISFDYYPISNFVDHESDYPQYNITYQQKSTTGRTSSYDDFASDKWYVTQDVYTTDGLVSALENKAVPNFVGSDTRPQRIYNQAKQILRQICDDTMTDYQKALAIHDYIVLNTSYDYTGLENTPSNQIGYYHYLEAFFDYGFTVCDGYAKTYSLLCNMEGIKTIRISGDAGGGHAWNKTYLDVNGDGYKEWLSVDCTWDDTATNISGTVYELMSHKYFMIPDSYIADRTEFIDYPQSITYGATYYDIFTIGGNTLKIDTVAQYNAITAYLKSSSYSGFEILLSTSVSAYASGIGKYTFSYDFVSGYNRVYIYKM